jgi:DNA-binding transcriptional regulator WhiA
MRQVENIRYIKEKMGFENLPENLRQIAELRLEYCDANLKELGEMLSPALGKSGVNHRLRKLDMIAQNQKESLQQNLSNEKESTRQNLSNFKEGNK